MDQQNPSSTDQQPQPSPESPFLWLYPMLLLPSMALLAWGIYIISRRPDYIVLAAGALATIGVLLFWVTALNLRARQEQESARQEAIFSPINERLQYVSVLMNQISEQQLISERAKAIAFRASERDALRRAIREEMSHKDWDAALILANDIEDVFGYKQEADRFRQEIAGLSDADVRRQVGDAIAAIDRLCRSEQWSQALREAERVMALYPNDAQAQHLPQDIELRRQSHKKQLLDSWHDAVTRHDVDGSIEILKRLDLYLTPTEAENLQETARQVFKDKLLLLGQQFTLAIRDHNWHEAIRVGETITKEFPNTRMAQEVRDKWELLRKRASEPEAARV